MKNKKLLFKFFGKLILLNILVLLSPKNLSGQCMSGCTEFDSICVAANATQIFKESFENASHETSGYNVSYSATSSSYYKAFGGTLRGFYLPEIDTLDSDDQYGQLGPNITTVSESSNSVAIVRDDTLSVTGDIPDGSRALNFRRTQYGSISFEFSCGDFTPGKIYYVTAEIGLDNNPLGSSRMQPSLNFSDSQGANQDITTLDFSGVNIDSFETVVFSFCAPTDCAGAAACEDNSGFYSFTIAQPRVTTEMGIIIDNIAIWESDCTITKSAGDHSCFAVCSEDTGMVSLYDQLDGFPDMGGVWTDPNGVVVADGMYDYASEAFGDYTYDVGSSADGCALTSTLEIAPGQIMWQEGFEAAASSFYNPGGTTGNHTMTISGSYPFLGYGFGGTGCTSIGRMYGHSANADPNPMVSDDNLGNAVASSFETFGSTSYIDLFNESTRNTSGYCLTNDEGTNSLRLGGRNPSESGLRIEFQCGSFTPGKRYFMILDVGYDNVLTTDSYADGLDLIFSTDLGETETMTFDFNGTTELQQAIFSFCPPASCGTLCNSETFELTLTRPGNSTKGGFVLDNIRIYEDGCEFTESVGEDNPVPIVVCNGDPAFNLFDNLMGIPDTDGTWSDPTLGGGNLGTFDPSIHKSGIYSYTKTSMIGCDITSCVQVIVKPTPAAPLTSYIPGFDYVAVCTDATEVGLSASCGENNCREGDAITMTYEFSGEQAITSSGSTIDLTGTDFPAGYEIEAIEAVELTYSYKIVYGQNPCTSTINRSYYRFIEFDMLTPTGTEMNIVDDNDYKSISYSSVFGGGPITTTFVDDPEGLPGATPAPGKYGAPGDGYSAVLPQGEEPNGVYKIRFPGRVTTTYAYCVTGAKVTIKARPVLEDEKYAWYPSTDGTHTAANTLDQIGDMQAFDPVATGDLDTSTPSETAWWTSCECNGCEGPEQASRVYVIGYENITATQVCNLATTSTSESEDYSIELCFDVPVEGPTPKFEVNMYKPGADEPVDFGVMNYADRDGSGCIILTNEFFDARDLEQGIEFKILDRDVGESCGSVIFNETSCCDSTTPEPDFSLPTLTCGEDFDLAPIDNNANTLITAMGVWSGSGATLINGSNVPGESANIDNTKVIQDYDYKLIYTITGGDGCNASVEKTFKLEDDCNANGGKF